MVAGETMTKQPRPLVSVIVCAHNEEKYMDKCLPSLLKALEKFESEIIFVADRCTDKMEKVKKFLILNHLSYVSTLTFSNMTPFSSKKESASKVGPFLDKIDRRFMYVG